MMEHTMRALDAVLQRIDRLALNAPEQLTITPVCEDKLRGILLGIAIGDALGNTSESYRPQDRNRAFGAINNYLPNRHADGRCVGLPSDDTQMSFWLLAHLLEDGRLEPERLADIFTTKSIFGVGQSVRGFRANRLRGLSWQAAGVVSTGNGAIMRIAPMLIMAGSLNGAEFARNVARCAAITHNEQGAIASAVAWVYFLAELSALHSLPARDDLVMRFLLRLEALEGSTLYKPRGGQMLGHFEGTLAAFIRGTVFLGLEKNMTPLAFGELTFSGAFLLETLPITLFLIAQSLDDPDRGICNAVNYTRDNDTIASLVASAMGAIHGCEAFQEEWISNLTGRTTENDDGYVQALIDQACKA
jgi:ADP-ribosyl-[dinitrogen reductase] hydrolase